MPLPRVAFLGPLNTYAHIATITHFGAEGFDPLPTSVPNACKMVRAGEADFAVLPIENSTAGFVETTLDAIYATAQIQVCDEVYIPIHHQLMSRETSLKAVKRIYSHSQAFAQTTRTLGRLQTEAGVLLSRMVVESTAAGAQLAASEPGAAAIASKEAAEKFGLNILAPNIEDRKNNTTRFWVMHIGDPPAPTGRDRTAFLVELAHRPGTLRALLSIFADRGLNMAWLQQRPIGGQRLSELWEYAFFLEYEGHITDEQMKDAYSVLKSGRSGIQRQGRAARLVGSYPNRMRPEEAH